METLTREEIKEACIESGQPCHPLYLIARKIQDHNIKDYNSLWRATAEPENVDICETRDCSQCGYCRAYSHNDNYAKTLIADITDRRKTKKQYKDMPDNGIYIVWDKSEDEDHFHFICLVNNKIVGVATAIPTQITLNNQNVLCQTIGAAYVDPQYRNKGIYKMIIKAIINTSNVPVIHEILSHDVILSLASFYSEGKIKSHQDFFNFLNSINLEHQEECLNEYLNTHKDKTFKLRKANEGT